MLHVRLERRYPLSQIVGAIGTVATVSRTPARTRKSAYVGVRAAHIVNFSHIDESSYP